MAVTLVINEVRALLLLNQSIDNLLMEVVLCRPSVLKVFLSQRRSLPGRKVVRVQSCSDCAPPVSPVLRMTAPQTDATVAGPVSTS